MNKLKAFFLIAVFICSYAQAQIQVSTAGNYGRLTINSGSVQDGSYRARVFNNVTYILGDFDMAVQASFPGLYTNALDVPPQYGGTTLDSITWQFYGQNGTYGCGSRCGSGIYLTYAPELNLDGSTISPPHVYLMTAQPELNPDGSPVVLSGFCGAQPCQLAQWQDVAPAVMADGSPAVFTHSFTNCTWWIHCDLWTLSGHLPAGNVIMNQDGTTTLVPILYLLHASGSACGGRGCGITGNAALFVTVPAFHTTYIAPPPCNDCGDD